MLKCHCAANSTRQYRPTAHSARCSPGYCMQCGVVSVKIHYTRILSPRIGLQRLQRHHSKMAVSRHLGFYRTANSAIRSADPENPSLEPNMEWIGCTVCEIFAFKLHCDLETGVRGHSRSSKLALFDRAHTTLYSLSIVICLYLLPFPRYSRILVENCYPLMAPPLGVKPSDLRNDP